MVIIVPLLSCLYFNVNSKQATPVVQETLASPIYENISGCPEVPVKSAHCIELVLPAVACGVTIVEGLTPLSIFVVTFVAVPVNAAQLGYSPFRS
jgi:hypothetical protein